MYSSNIYSHPGVKLHQHMENVADSCLNKFREQSNNLIDYFISEHWENLIWSMGFFHDFGKSTKAFQTYLFEEDPVKRLKLKGIDSSHSLFSAVITHFIIKKYCDQYNDIDNDLFKLMPFLCFLGVKKHHGNLLNSIPFGDSEENSELDSATDHLDRQLNSCDKDEIALLFSIFSKKTGIVIDVEDLPDSLIDYFKKNIRRIEKNSFKKLKKNPYYYYIFHYIFSLLLHSDKEDAIFKNKVVFERHFLDVDAVNKFKDKNFNDAQEKKKRINIIRESIFHDAHHSLESIDFRENRIFSLNVPTGTGKTFTSLSVALKIREKMQDFGVSRIIYALPFTSIIDQNFSVFEDVLGNPETSVLMKHHHMTDLFYANKEADFESHESRFLIESWESEIIVTTFFQIFHTLFSNRNRMLQKYNRLANSIVLLDEIQSVPYKYWPLLKNAISRVSEIFNTCFVLITATQPRIFNQNEIIELVPEKDKYFRELDRVDIEFFPEKITLSDYIKTCVREISRNCESFLFVMNTINSSIELFEAIRDLRLDDVELFYLATNIIPKERLNRIKLIKKKNGKRKIIVSTQMIEAGVDIDVENVWRDLGPLESINQVCGRCNRSFASKRGKVRVYNIVNENHNNTPFARYIYGKESILSLTETLNIFKEQTKVNETDFLTNIEKYYESVENKMRCDDSENLIHFMEELRFSDIYKNFRLIADENYVRKDIFIETDENAEEVWSEFCKIFDIEDFFERKSCFHKIRKKMNDYVISVPEKFANDEEFRNTGLIYINKERVDSCYDSDIGWIRKQEGVYTF